MTQINVELIRLRKHAEDILILAGSLNREIEALQIAMDAEAVKEESAIEGTIELDPPATNFVSYQDFQK